MHYDKFIEAGENISIAGSVLKWYRMAKQDEPVPDAVEALALRFLESDCSM